jgi:hypothetical protein
MACIRALSRLDLLADRLGGRPADGMSVDRSAERAREEAVPRPGQAGGIAVSRRIVQDLVAPVTRDKTMIPVAVVTAASRQAPPWWTRS